MGIPGAIVSGRMAADVAIEAVRAGDVSSKKLGRYEEMYRPMKGEKGFTDSPHHPFYQRSDEEIERILKEIL
jgi:flavin-dependent dehydrogenase